MTEGIAELSERLWQRERQFSTRVSPSIAIPHIVLPGLLEPAIVFGISREGVMYEPGDVGPVHLIVLLLSDRETHIGLLSGLARLLQRDRLIEHLGAAVLEQAHPRRGHGPTGRCRRQARRDAWSPVTALGAWAAQRTRGWRRAY